MKEVSKKILEKYFEDVKKGIKTFEVRKDEDDIQVGDILILEEWKEGDIFTSGYTGRCIRKRVKYVLRDIPQYGLQEGYCIIGLEDDWIPCSVRLPENNKVVLCWVKSTTIASGETYIIGSCDRGFWFLQTYEIGHHHFPVKDYEVVAWQQLPEEYQPAPQEPWKDAMMNTFLAGKV